jgi:hypothetical protein
MSNDYAFKKISDEITDCFNEITKLKQEQDELFMLMTLSDDAEITIGNIGIGMDVDKRNVRLHILKKIIEKANQMVTVAEISSDIYTEMYKEYIE